MIGSGGERRRSAESGSYLRGFERICAESEFKKSPRGIEDESQKNPRRVEEKSEEGSERICGEFNQYFSLGGKNLE